MDRISTTDPLTAKGKEIHSAMTQQYGEKKGEQVFHASANAGTITGVDTTAAGLAKMTAITDPIGDGKNVRPRNAFVVGDYK